MGFFIHIIREEHIRSMRREVILYVDRILDMPAFQASPSGCPLHETIFYHESSAL
jgi:hypothetical protein